MFGRKDEVIAIFVYLNPEKLPAVYPEIATAEGVNLKKIMQFGFADKLSSSLFEDSLQKQKVSVYRLPEDIYYMDSTEKDMHTIAQIAITSFVQEGHSKEELKNYEGYLAKHYFYNQLDQQKDGQAVYIVVLGYLKNRDRFWIFNWPS